VYRSAQTELHRDETGVRNAVRFSVVVAVAAVAFLVFAALWVSTCSGSTADTMACGAPQRTLLALGAPLILLLGGLRAFVRTYELWRHGGTWWPWQGAGWFLMITMLLILTGSLTPIVGPGLGA
jgi:hypothetical protein